MSASTQQPSANRIVMLANSTHPPTDTRIFQKEAKTLLAAGYEVTIIVPHTESFIRDGINIIAVPLHKKGFGKLLINPWNVLRKALQQPRSAIFHIHDSELLMIGMVLWMFRRRIIYDAHEDTPKQISYQHWIPGPLKKPYAWFYYLLEKICGWCFDAIIIAEPVIGQYFPKHKTVLIRNFPKVESFKKFAQVPLLERQKKLVYIGLLSKVRGLQQMVDAAKEAQRTTVFEFVLGGQFAPPSLQTDIVGNYPVNFVGWVNSDALVASLFSSRVGIIIPNPIERYKTNYPVKLFEYMAAGLPVIASDQGEASAFVRESGCGILVDPLDVEQIAGAIIELMNNDREAAAMGASGQRLVFEKYNWEREGEVLLALYSRLFKSSH